MRRRSTASMHKCLFEIKHIQDAVKIQHMVYRYMLRKRKRKPTESLDDLTIHRDGSSLVLEDTELCLPGGFRSMRCRYIFSGLFRSYQPCIATFFSCANSKIRYSHSLVERLGSNLFSAFDPYRRCSDRRTQEQIVLSAEMMRHMFRSA
jgi:hypothetical protein